MKTNEITVNELINSNVLINSEVEQMSNELEETIKKLQGKSRKEIDTLNSILSLEGKDNLNSWERLRLTAKKTELETFSLSKIAKAFIKVGEETLTRSQIECLTFEAIKDYVLDKDVYKNKSMFTINDIKLICNALIKANDNATKLALKVAKQGGTITQ
jgi:hypothetical protein